MIEPYKRKTLARLKRAKGQLEGIMKMVEGDEYCVDIVTQVLALEGSLKGVSRFVLESHLNSCAAEQFGSPDPDDRAAFIKEISTIFDFAGR